MMTGVPVFSTVRSLDWTETFKSVFLGRERERRLMKMVNILVLLECLKVDSPVCFLLAACWCRAV